MFLSQQHHEEWQKQYLTVPNDNEGKDLSPEIVQEIAEYFRDKIRSGRYHLSSLRNYVMWLWMEALGLRGGELLSLRLGDVPMSYETFWLRVPENNVGDPRRNPPSPKTGSRDLRLHQNHEAISDFTRAYLQLRGNCDHDYVFVSAHGQPLSVSSFHGIARQVKCDVLDAFHWHRVRHTHAVRLLMLIAEKSQSYAEFNHKFNALLERMGWSSAESAKPYLERGLLLLNARSLDRLLAA